LAKERKRKACPGQTSEKLQIEIAHRKGPVPEKPAWQKEIEEGRLERRGKTKVLLLKLLRRSLKKER